jgi:hypothetical protein
MQVGKEPKIKILKFLKNAGPTIMNYGISKIEDGEFIPFKKKHIIFKFFWLKKKKIRQCFQRK